MADTSSAFRAVFIHFYIWTPRWFKVHIGDYASEAASRAQLGDQRAIQAEGAQTRDESDMALGPIAS